MEVKLGKQTHPKKQPVQVEISTCSFQVSYDPRSAACMLDVGNRCKSPSGWGLVQVLGTQWEPWWLITD